MAIDFEEQFGINAGYVESLYESWRSDAASVDPEWASFFAASGPTTERSAPASPPPRESDDQYEVEALRGRFVRPS